MGLGALGEYGYGLHQYPAATASSRELKPAVQFLRSQRPQQGFSQQQLLKLLGHRAPSSPFTFCRRRRRNRARRRPLDLLSARILLAGSGGVTFVGNELASLRGPRRSHVLCRKTQTSQNYSEQGANPGVAYGNLVRKTLHADSINGHKIVDADSRRRPERA